MFGHVRQGSVVVGLEAWVAAVRSFGGVGDLEELDAGLLCVAGASAGFTYHLLQYSYVFE